MTSVIYFLFGMSLTLNFIFFIAILIAYKVYSNKKYSVENALINNFIKKDEVDDNFKQFFGSGKV